MTNLEDMNAQVFSVAHGGKGSGCCCYCDDDLTVRVVFDDGTTARAWRFRPSTLGKGFAKITMETPGGGFTRTILTPRDRVERLEEGEER